LIQRFSCPLTSVGLAGDAITSGVLLGSIGWNGDWPVPGFAELQTKQVAALSTESPRSCWSPNSTCFDTQTDQLLYYFLHKTQMLNLFHLLAIQYEGVIIIFLTLGRYIPEGV